MTRWLLVSAALHAIVVLVLYRSLRHAPEPTEPVPVFAWAPEPARPVPPPRGRAKRRSAGKRHAKAPSLKDLGIDWSRHGDVSLPSLTDETGIAQGAEDPGVAEGDGIGGRGGNLLGQMKGTVDYQRIHDSVEEALDYPVELQEAGIEGTVRARIVIDGAGRFSKERSRFESSSRFLRVYVLRLVRRVLSEPLRHHRRGHELEFRALFQFELTRQGSPFATGRSGIAGNHLAFHRQSSKLFGQWDLGPLSGYGPLPAVSVNPEWFVDKITDATSNKAKRDPLDKYRDDPEF